MSAPSPTAVGNKFVVQYYTQLNQNPGSLRLFYKENSVFTHGSESSFGETEETVTGVEEINKKIQKLDFKDCHVTLSVVDCQASRNGVFILVVGFLSNKGEAPRKFVQSFFLSEHNKTFFVLNDVFRFVDDSKPQQAQAPVSEPAKPHQEEPVAKPVVQEPVHHIEPVHHHEPVESKPKENKPSAPAPSTQEAATTHVAPKEQPQEPAVKAIAPPAVKQAAPSPQPPKKEASPPAKKATAPPPQQEEKPAGPKSWSNIVGVVASPQQEHSPVVVAQPPRAQAVAVKDTQPPKPRKERRDDKTFTPSLFISNIPFGATEEQLRGLFSPFGEIKSVIIAEKGYVFMDYATVEQAQKAIEGAKNGQLSLDTRVLTVVESRREKKHSSRDSGRPPRERSDRGERPDRRERPDNRGERNGKPSASRDHSAKQ